MIIWDQLELIIQIIRVNISIKDITHLTKAMMINIIVIVFIKGQLVRLYFVVILKIDLQPHLYQETQLIMNLRLKLEEE